MTPPRTPSTPRLASPIATPNLPRNPSLNDPTNIKYGLKRLKKLEVVHSKFATKSNYVTKTNILRKTLLPYLRVSNTLELPGGCDVQVQRSLESVLTAVLLRWWSSLLGSVALTSLVSSTDRNAYLEGISRIISRSEWFSADKDTLRQYRQLLVSTLDYAISRLLSLKVVPVAFLAFVGKVFAYSYFHIPKVSNALLFLLNVRVGVIKRAGIPAPANSTTKPFPSSVQTWVNFSGISVPKNREHINCVPPPHHPVDGIKDPNGTWVPRWCASDSDIFFSFLHHYLNVCLHYVDDDYDPLNLPGFKVILAHVFHILETSVNRMALANADRPADRQLSGKVPPKGNLAAPVLKALKTFRDFNYSNTSFRHSLCRNVDSLLVQIAKTSSIYDYHKNSVILNVAHEIVHQVGQDVDWEFWLGCVYMMLQNTDHAQSLIKSFSFLFNVWDQIPETLPNEAATAPHLKWLTDSTASFKVNFINWLISQQSWERLFTHWNPLVSSYYIRLLVWRVIGINNFESSIAIQTTKKVESRVRKAHQMLLDHDKSANKNVYKPDSPLGGRKLGIVPVSIKDEFYLAGDVSSPSVVTTPSEIRKTHPYEIFDEAVYSCSSLPVTPRLVSDTLSETVDRRRSLVTSIGKFFKMLSTEEPKKPPTLGKSRNSVSMTSLSTAYSTKSQSSSPSVMSYRSTPTSITENGGTDSDTSSISTDTWSPHDEQTQPPELFTTVPEVVRPALKFELIYDHDSLSQKYFATKLPPARVDASRYIPELPEIPSISIFVRADPYDRFYLTQESDLMILNDVDDAQPVALCADWHHSEVAKWEKLGKRLNEWNLVVEEFEKYMIHRVETDQLNSRINAPLVGGVGIGEINEANYFKKIVPFLLVEEANDLKMNGG